jgi:hypothetical protein
LRDRTTEAVVCAVWTVAKAALCLLGLLVLVFLMTLAAISLRVGPAAFIAAFLACVLLTYTVYRSVPLAFLAGGIISPLVWWLAHISLVGT